eukprot:TRINITY_DN18787_c0_g1_i7.p1 TRINITY_DN18787_c0_g1~~TRINITY_DN18787_c0_g1_i7.p1  ORF type:complete len:377 (+),score=73.05 TRINITY_DN18787_c0_g1_i7:70-1200(+)
MDPLARKASQRSTQGLHGPQRWSDDYDDRAGTLQTPVPSIEVGDETDLYQDTLDALLRESGDKDDRRADSASMSTSAGLSLFDTPLFSPLSSQFGALESGPWRHREASSSGFKTDLDDDGRCEAPVLLEGSTAAYFASFDQSRSREEDQKDATVKEEELNALMTLLRDSEEQSPIVPKQFHSKEEEEEDIDTGFPAALQGLLTQPDEIDRASMVESLLADDEPEVWTVVLQNISATCTSSDVASFLRLLTYNGKFDFIYVPRDMPTKRSLGYAIVSFTSLSDCQCFSSALKRLKLKCPGMDVPMRAVPAKVQGFTANVSKWLRKCRVKDTRMQPMVYTEQHPEGIGLNKSTPAMDRTVAAAVRRAHVPGRVNPDDR